MGLFGGPEEQKRKENLKKLEDKRVAFAQRLAREGFAPERMLFAQNDNGGFTGLARYGGHYWVIVSPGFGSDDEFIFESFDAPDYTVQQVNVKPEGMGGIFGFGKKGETGVEYIIHRENGEDARLPLIAGRNNWLESHLAKNPLLKTQRRRGNANLVWDFKPLDLSTIERCAEQVAADAISNNPSGQITMYFDYQGRMLGTVLADGDYIRGNFRLAGSWIR